MITIINIIAAGILFLTLCILAVALLWMAERRERERQDEKVGVINDMMGDE